MESLEKKNELQILRDLLEVWTEGGDGDKLGDVEEEGEEEDKGDVPDQGARLVGGLATSLKQ